MSKEQRAKIDAMLRQPRPAGLRSVEELRAGFRTLMAGMLVPDAISTTATTLGSRPALLVEPTATARDRSRARCRSRRHPRHHRRRPSRISVICRRPR